MTLAEYRIPSRRCRAAAHPGQLKTDGGLRTGGALAQQALAHRNFSFEKTRNGAAGLGFCRGLLERRFVTAGNARRDVEMDFRDGETGLELFHRQRGCSFDAFRRDARVAELRRKSHGEAA